MNGTDKRRARRFPITLPALVKADDVANESATVSTKDVSSSGIYFEFTAPLELGTALEFILTLPEQITKGNAVRIKCMGKVVRVDHGRADVYSSVGIAATIERYEFLR